MSQAEFSTAEQKGILICDTNVVMMMAIFDMRLMFSATYTYGEIEIVAVVIQEIQRWLKGGKKLQKYGKEFLDSVILAATQRSGKIRSIPAPKLKTILATLSAQEHLLAIKEKGSATSEPDRTVLALAAENEVNLATQERALRALATKVIGPKKVISFEEMVADLVKQGVVTDTILDDGMRNLDHFKERVNSERMALVYTAQKARKPEKSKETEQKPAELQPERNSSK